MNLSIDLSNKGKGISTSVTLAITAKAKKMKAEGIDIISFGAGEPDFKTPLNIRLKAKSIIDEGNIGYTPASGLKELKKAICNKLYKDNNLRYKVDNIVVSNGAKHSLFNTLQAICNPGDEVLVPKPYWVSYPELIKLADSKSVFLDSTEENNFKFTINQLKNKISKKTKALILNSPNNPTGSVYTKYELKLIAEVAIDNNIFIISDEIYEKLIYDDNNHISIASLNDKIKDLTIVVNGMSKAYAMTGWRIGYIAARKDIANIITNIQSHSTSNPNTIAQYASIEALEGDQSEINNMIKEFSNRRKLMVDRINSIPILSSETPRGAFYVMVNIEKIIGTELNGNKINGSMDLANYLLDTAKVAVIPGNAFDADKYIRLSYATSRDNIEEGIKRIDNALR